MRIRGKMLGIILISILLSASSAQAKVSPAFGFEIKQSASGRMHLKANTYVSEPGMWLGVTFYPPQGEAREPVHLKFALKVGYALTQVEIQPNLMRGTFEAALWKGSLSKQQCVAEDAFCKKEGYRLYGMTAYSWGTLGGF